MSGSFVQLRVLIKRPIFIAIAITYSVASFLLALKGGNAFSGNALNRTIAFHETVFLPIFIAVAIGVVIGTSSNQFRLNEFDWIQQKKLGTELFKKFSLSSIVTVTAVAVYLFTGFLAEVLNPGRSGAFIDSSTQPDLHQFYVPIQLAVICVLVGIFCTFVGSLFQRISVALLILAVLFFNSFYLFLKLVGSAPAITFVGQFMPSGAVSYLLGNYEVNWIFNGGVRGENFTPRSVFFGFGILLAWTLFFVAVLWFKNRKERIQSENSGGFFVLPLLAGFGLTLLIGIQGPSVLEDRLGWMYKPSWIAQERTHTTSRDVVQQFISELKEGQISGDSIDSSIEFWQPIVLGSVEVKSKFQMGEPNIVYVEISDFGNTRVKQLIYEFQMAPANSTWEISSVTIKERTYAN